MSLFHRSINPVEIHIVLRSRGRVSVCRSERRVRLFCGSSIFTLPPAPAVQVLSGLADNKLTLVTDSPLVAAASMSSVEARRTSDGLTAVLLSETGFKAQILEASARPGATGLPSSSSLAARLGRIELEAQLAFAAGRGGGAVPGAYFSSPSFAVRLNPRSRRRKHMPLAEKDAVTVEIEMAALLRGSSQN